MCRGSHGCGAPIVRSLRRRLLMRFISSTTAPFYNLRPLVAGELRDEPRARKRRGTESPPFKVSPQEATALFVLAQEEQVQERQDSGKGSSYVGEGRRRQHTPGAARLTGREHAVAGQEAVGAGGGVDLQRQRHHVKGQHRQEQDRRELDKELSGPTRAAYKDTRDEQVHPDLAAESHDREDSCPQLHRQVAASVLDRVPDLVGRHTDRSDGVLSKSTLREPHRLAPRVVVVGKLSGDRLDLHVSKIVAVQNHARRLRTSQPACAHLLGVLLVRAPYPERRGPGDQHPDDHQDYVAKQQLFLLKKNLSCNAYILLHPYTQGATESCLRTRFSHRAEYVTDSSARSGSGARRRTRGRRRRTGSRRPRRTGRCGSSVRRSRCSRGSPPKRTRP